MRAIEIFLVLATTSVLLSACGGGNGKSQQVRPPDPPAAPVVTVGADIKQLIFSWDAVAAVTHYRLLENPDGHSGFTQVGADIAATESSVTRVISAHLFDWTNSQYVVEACNALGCGSSDVVIATDAMIDAIGYFKASDTDMGDGFGWSVALSADGSTIAVAALYEDSGAIGVNGDQFDDSAAGSGAVYLFRHSDSGWHQQAFIKPSNTDFHDAFGWAVALSADGNTLAAGAPREDSGANGINGDQSDNTSPDAGAAYLFRFDGADWYQQAYIKASNTSLGAAAEVFGYSVALSSDGNILVVGAREEHGSATGVNGDQTVRISKRAGAAYLFRYDGIDWYQQAYIKASNTHRKELVGGDRFGHSVALSNDGNTLAVGAPYEESSATGINGDQLDNTADTSGAVYLYRFDGADWFQQAYVKASNTGSYDRFGYSVDLSANGNVLAVGADQEGSGAMGVNGDQDDNAAEGSGAAYLFQSDGATWYQAAYIKASNTGALDKFGYSVALSADGSTLAVGARTEDSSATGVNADQTDDSLPRAGAAYVFRFDGTDWVQYSYIKSSDTNVRPGDFGDFFGQAVSLGTDGGTLVIGAPREDSAAIGIDGDPADNSAIGSGAVYVY